MESHIANINESLEYSSPKQPLKLTAEAKTLILAGSVGQPRHGTPDVYYVIYDPSAKTVQWPCVTYDYKKTQRKITKAKLPAIRAHTQHAVSRASHLCLPDWANAMSQSGQCLGWGKESCRPKPH